MRLQAPCTVGWIVLAQACAATGMAATDPPASWRPNWVDGRYWIVESDMLRTKLDPLSGALAPPEAIGKYRTRFTVRLLQSGLTITIEPRVVGPCAVENPSDYELLLHGDELAVQASTVRGRDMAGEAYVHVDRRLKGDPSCWWIHPWSGSGTFPESLVLAWPLFTATSPGVFAIPTRTGIGHPQIVTVLPDGAAAVELRDSGNHSVIGEKRLVFRAGQPWYEVMDNQGRIVNRIVEVGIR